MHPTALLAALLAVAVGATAVSAQELSAYREYAFGSSVASIVAQTTSQVMSVKTVHERPATIQQLEWFAPYTPDGPDQDPVRNIVFRFVDDRLYEMVVTYDTKRTEGMTTADVIAALASTYGPPLLADSRAARLPRAEGMGVDTVIAASWRDAVGTIALYRNLYAVEYQLLIRSSELAKLAGVAAARSEVLDKAEAPRREREERQREADAATAKATTTRTANKAAFRP